MRNKQFPFWVFTISVLIALVVPVLIEDGMFMDGMLYTCVAKNLSQGIGSFWLPRFSETLHPLFDQQPPLGFGIMAVFFKLFGTSIYVERFYSFVTLCLGAFLIAEIWKIFFKGNVEIKKIAWLPVLFWIIIPVCFWSYANNMLECSMVIFDLLAILFVLKFFENKFVIHLLLAGVFIFLASLTKGFQGLFPLAAVFFHWLAFRKISFVKMIRHSLILFAVPAIIYVLLFQNENAHHGLSAYIHNRVQNSISSVSTVDSRFYLIGRLGQELLPSLALSLVLFFIFRKKKTQAKNYFRHILFFLLIGISASFPLIVTLEQRGFYLVTSLPFFGIAIAIICAPYLSPVVEKINPSAISFRIFRAFTVLLFVGALFFSGLQ
ncbi:MAG TPA: glycosyltransferase family 39 protein, partial [Bacteroidia bacterium]